MGKWDNNAWGMYVDANVTDFNFKPAMKNGMSFVVGQMNTGYQKANKNWANMVQKAYDDGVKIVGGVYHLDMYKYNQLIPDFGLWPVEKHVLPEHDLVWQDLASLIKSKYMQFLVIKIQNFWEFTDEKRLSPPWASAILSGAIERARAQVTKMNPRIKYIMFDIDEGIIRRYYPDLGQNMSYEDWSFSTYDTVKYAYNIYSWAEIKSFYPPNVIVGYDGEEHSNPPISFAKNWMFWRWMSRFVSSDFKRLEGMGLMGTAFFNGDKAKLEETFGVTIPTPVPDTSGSSTNPDTSGSVVTPQEPVVQYNLAEAAVHFRNFSRYLDELNSLL